MFGGGKFGEFGESSVIRQTKTIQTFPLNYIQSSCVTHLVLYTILLFIAAVALLYSELLFKSLFRQYGAYGEEDQSAKWTKSRCVVATSL